MSKAKYLFESIAKAAKLSKYKCPSCGMISHKTVDRKLMITTLRHCLNCDLQYRTPTTSEQESKTFYEEEYSQPGLTTDLPSREELFKLIECDFIETEKDHSHLKDLLRLLASEKKDRLRVLDYGANWGYGVYQIDKFPTVSECVGYEYSDVRRRYGQENLGIRYVEEKEFGDEKFDLIFSSHVIEHMFNPSLLLSHAEMLLKKDGWLVIVCPNGSYSARIANQRWSKLWGSVHPNLISDQYLCSLFSWYKGGIYNEQYDEKSANLYLSNHNKKVSSYMPKTPNLLAVLKRDGASEPG